MSPSPTPEQGHPYRTAGVLSADTEPRKQGLGPEDRVILVAIALVGVLGLAVGLVAPSRTMEPSLGVILLYFAGATLVHEARTRRT